MAEDPGIQTSETRNPGRLVCIRTFRDLPQGELARSRLAAEGLAAQLADEFIVGINWLFSQAVGGVSVLVAATEAREAIAVMAEDRTEDLLEELGLGEHDIETCPSCGSLDVAYRSRRVALAAWYALLPSPVLLLGSGFFQIVVVGLVSWILLRPRWRCRKCGSTFRDL
jgi:hypothetical protein